MPKHSAAAHPLSTSNFPSLGAVGSSSSSSSSAPTATATAAAAMGSHANGTGAGAGAGGTPAANGLPPPPAKWDVSQAQMAGLQDAYWSDEEEDNECPLCLEEMDISDTNFKPCPCGYQICRFCWHHIKENLNGRCPACRRLYSDQAIEFKPMTADEIKKLTQAKKQKEREKKELEAMNRKHLAEVRIVQKNLVYVVGLSPKLTKEEHLPALRSNEYFGQYGRIAKIVINKRSAPSTLMMGTSESQVGVYITYHRKEDAARAIVAIDGSSYDGKVIRASYGTTKYCTNYLRNQPCTNVNCMYLHEPGEDGDTFTKEDLATLKHAMKDTEHKFKPAPSAASVKKLHEDAAEASALPKTASWASANKPASQPTTPIYPNGPGLPNLSGARAPRVPVGKAVQAHQQQLSAKQMHQQHFPPPTTSGPLPPVAAAAAAAKSKAAPLQMGRKRSTSVAMASPVKSSSSAVAQQKGRTASGPAPNEPAPSSSTPAPSSTSAAAPASTTPTKASGAGAAPPGLSGSKQALTANPSSSSSFSARAPSPSAEQETAAAPSAERAPPTSPSKSTYQVSSQAQALLDDLKARREAEPDLPNPSPFPDFDHTLACFQNGGDFSFTLNIPTSSSSSGLKGGNGGQDKALDGSEQSTATTTTTTTAAGPGSIHNNPPPGIIAAGAAFSTLGGTPPPGFAALRAVGSRSASPSPFSYSYSGSFDPFSESAGTSINSPFSSIDEMQRTLTLDARRTGGDEATEPPDADGPSVGGRKSSRFDFARRKSSSSSAQASGTLFASSLTGLTSLAAANSPHSSIQHVLYGSSSSPDSYTTDPLQRQKSLADLYGEAASAAGGGEPLSVTKDMRDALGIGGGGGGDQTGLGWNVGGGGGLDGMMMVNNNGGRQSPYAGLPPNLGRQLMGGGAGGGGSQLPPGIPPSIFRGASSTPPPPGIVPRTQQTQTQSQSQYGEQQQQRHGGAIGGGTPAWLAELQLQQQQQQQVQQQQLRMGSGAYGGDGGHVRTGSGMIGGGVNGGGGLGRSSDPLLGQILGMAVANGSAAAAGAQGYGAGYSGGAGGAAARQSDLPFFDPAIMSVSRPPSITANASAANFPGFSSHVAAVRSYQQAAEPYPSANDQNAAAAANPAAAAGLGTYSGQGMNGPSLYSSVA